MKQILSFILLVLWLILTLILVFTLIGIIFILDDDSQWKQFGKQLLQIFKES